MTRSKGGVLVVDIAFAPALGVLLTLLSQEGPADRPSAIVERPAGEVAGEATHDLAGDIETLEAMLRVRESRINEARRFVELERDVLDTVRQQTPSGAAPPRQLELVEVRYASAEALLEARQAERDELAIRLEALKRAAASPSPESDRDELRAALEDEVRIREAQLRAREARVKAAEAQVTSENRSRDTFVDSVRRGIASVGAARQAMFRVAEAHTWRDTMVAEREVAGVQLERARRRLARFDDPESTDPGLARTDVDDLEARVAALEHLTEVLRDEIYHMQWELQIFRNMQHERFGTR